NKRIPAFLLDPPQDDLLKECPRGMFNGDGYFTAQAGRKSGILSLTTVSEILAYQIRHVCLRWGIKSSIHVRRRAGRRTAYDVIWSGASAHGLSRILYGEDVIEGNRSFE